MAKFATTTELRKMPLIDLQRDIRESNTKLAKLRLEVHLRKQKDTAMYVREKKHLARMKTIEAEKLAEELQAKAAPTKVNDPTPASSEADVSSAKKTKKSSPSKS